MPKKFPAKKFQVNKSFKLKSTEIRGILFNCLLLSKYPIKDKCCAVFCDPYVGSGKTITVSCKCHHFPFGIFLHFIFASLSTQMFR